MSFGLREQIWRVLDGHLRQLLLMTSDCPLAIRHKKGKYIWVRDFIDKGRLLLFSSFGAFRLYLGASSCIYFLANDLFCFIWVVYDRGRYCDVFISCFTLCCIDY